MRIALASLIALGLASAGLAQAQAPLPGEAMPSGNAGNIVGGGFATITGGGDETTIVYGSTGAGAGAGVAAQPGRVARIVGNDGDGPQIEYLTPAPAQRGREAWLLGGGDEGRVVYESPHRR